MSSNALAVQQIPSLKSAPFRSRLDLSYSKPFTTDPDIVYPLASIKGEVGDTLDISIDLQLLMLYLQSLVVDALQCDVYAFYTKYSQVYNKYTRVKGENLSVSTDDRKYTMSKITSTYPAVYYFKDDSLYANALKWKQNGIEMVPKVFDTSNGSMVDPKITIRAGTLVDGAWYVGGFGSSDEYNQGFLPGSLPDALGYNVGMPCLAYTAAHVVAYYLTCDYYFRNAEIFDSMVGLVPDVDVNRPWNIWSEWQGMVADPNYTYGSVCAFYNPFFIQTNKLTGLAPGGFYRSSRKPDYVSLGLASPTFQGLDVVLPTTLSLEDSVVPVVGNGMTAGFTDGTNNVGLRIAGGSPNPMQAVPDAYGQPVGSGIGSPIGSSKSVGLTTDPANSGMVVNLGSASVAFDPGTIQETRTGFQMLKYLEAKNRAGKYFGDIIYNFFGISDPRGDTRFPEWVGLLTGGFNFVKNQQTSASGDTPQGNIAMNAGCEIRGHLCKKTFTEDGLIQVFMVVRQPSVVFQDRVDRSMFEFEELDFMNPLFARLGDQPVYNHEVYVPALTQKAFARDENPWMTDVTAWSRNVEVAPNLISVDSDIQKELDDMWQPNSYQERYADKKYSFNQVSGMFRSRARIMASFYQPLYSSYQWSNNVSDYVCSILGGTGVDHLIPLDNQTYSLSFDDGRRILGSGDAGLLNFLGRQGLTPYSSGRCPSRVEATLSKSVTPFGKNVFNTKYPLIQGQYFMKVIADRIVPVRSAPGLADHQ